MAEIDKVVQELEFGIDESSFIAGLTKVTKVFDTTLLQLNSSSAKVGQSIVSLHSQVLSSLSSLGENTSNKIKQGYDAVTKGNNELLQSSRNLTRQVEHDLSAMTKSASTLAAQYYIIANKAAKEKSNLSAGTIGIEEYNKNISFLKEAYLKEAKAVRDGIVKLQSDSDKRISEFATKATSQLLKNIEFGTKNIDSSVMGLKNKINKTIGDLSKTVSVTQAIPLYVSGKEEFSQIKIQMKQLNSELKELDKQRVISQEWVKNSRMAFERQTNAELKLLAKLDYDNAVAHNNQLVGLYKKTQNNLKGLGTAYSGSSKTFDKGMFGSQLKIDLFEKYKKDVDQYNRFLETSEKLLTKIQTRLASGGDVGGLSSSYIKVQTLIAGISNELNVSVGLMKQLGKAGISFANDAIGGMNKQIASLKELQKEQLRVYEYQNKIATSSLLSGSQTFIGTQQNKLMGMSALQGAAEIKFGQQNLKDIFGIQKASESYNELSKLMNQKERNVEAIERQITKLTNEEYKTRSLAANEANKQMQASMFAYADKVKDKIEQLRKIQGDYNKTFTSQSLGGYGSQFKTGVESYIGNIKDLQQSWNMIDKIRGGMEQAYNEVVKHSKRSGSAHLEMAKNAEMAFARYNNALKSNHVQITEAITNLKSISKMGFNVEPMIADLKKLQTTYKTVIDDMHGSSVKASNMVKVQAQEQSKAWYTHIGETIRNFRWQYAAVAYIMQQLYEKIKNTFLNILHEIDEFRKNIYSMVGTVGVGMGDSFKENFDVIFEYSRDLMERLQAKAATTYASLQDMIMVTRSFMQGGIFPKSAQDIENIATITTAVKVMTEGMANSGVQMRQEVMALIEGRTRVTDSVARMLKMSVGDLNKIMKDWESQGINKLEGFAQLLDSFAEINRRNSKEYGVQVNNLKEMWNYIKRIAGEKLTLQIAEDIKNFVKDLGVTGESLTEFGQNVMKVVRGWLLGLYEFLKMLGSIAKSVFDVFADISSLFGSMSADKSLSAWARVLDSILKTFASIEMSVRAILLPFSLVINLAKALVNYGIAAAKAFSRDIPGALKSIAEANSYLAKPFEQAQQMVIDFNVGMKNATRTAKELDKAITTDNTQKALSDEITKQKAAVAEANKLIDEINTQIEKNKSKDEKSADRIKKWQDALYGEGDKKGAIDRLNTNIAEAEKKLQELTKSTQNNVKEIETSFIGASESMVDVVKINNSLLENLSGGVKDFIKDNVESLKNTWKELNDNFTTNYPILAKILGFIGTQGFIEEKKGITGEAAGGIKAEVKTPTDRLKEQIEKDKQDLIKLKEEAQKKLQEGINSELELQARNMRSLEDQWDQYIGLLEKANKIDPFEKVKYSTWKDLAELEKINAENDPEKRNIFVQQNYADLQKAIWEKYNNDIIKMNVKKASDLESFTKEALGKEQSDIENINEKYKKMQVNLEELEIIWRLTAVQKEKLENDIATGKALAYQRLQIKYEKELLAIKNETANIQISLLERSLVPMVQQQGAIMRIEQEWRNYCESLKIAREESEKKYGSESEQFKLITQKMQEQYEFRKKLYQEELTDVQEPFWAKMKDLARGWADDFSSALTDVIFDLDNAFDTMQNFFKSVSKQILNAFIKEKLINPMVNSLSGKSENTSKESGGWNWVTGFLGLGKKAEDKSGAVNPFGSLGAISTTNPLPVTIVNGFGQDLFGNVNTTSGIPIDKTFTSNLGQYYSANVDNTTNSKLIAETIKQIESGGNYSVKGGSGEYGAYQFMPSTWKNLSLKYFGSNLEMSTSNQDLVAQTYIQELLNKGFNEKQIASIWNSGSANWEGKIGYNKVGQYYNVPNYVNNFDKVYQEKLETLKSPYEINYEAWDTKEAQSSLTQLESPYKLMTQDFLKKESGITDTSSLLSSESLNTMTISANIVNVNGGIGTSDSGNNLTKTGSGMDSIFNSLSGVFSKIKSSFSGLFNSIIQIFSGLGNTLSGMFGSSGSSGGLGGILGSLFGGSSGGSSSPFSFTFAEGGLIDEPVVGKGLRSGKSYSFGENESELVTPMSKLASNSNSIKGNTTIHMPIYLQAIDSKSGVEFLAKNSDVLQAMIADKMTSNKQVRKSMKRSW